MLFICWITSAFTLYFVVVVVTLSLQFICKRFDELNFKVLLTLQGNFS